MYFQKLRPQLRHHLQGLLCNSETNNLIRLALQSILMDTERYENYCTMDSPFREHFEATLSKEELTLEDIFMTLEDLLIFIRETSLRTGAHLLPAEKMLLDWAERQEEWRLGDGTLFSDFFYAIIPARVLHDLANPNSNQS